MWRKKSFFFCRPETTESDFYSWIHFLLLSLFGAVPDVSMNNSSDVSMNIIIVKKIRNITAIIREGKTTLTSARENGTAAS